MTKRRVITEADVCKAHVKNLMLRVCGITKSCTTMKIISL